MLCCFTGDEKGKSVSYCRLVVLSLSKELCRDHRKEQLELKRSGPSKRRERLESSQFFWGTQWRVETIGKPHTSSFDPFYAVLLTETREGEKLVPLGSWSLGSTNAITSCRESTHQINEMKQRLTVTTSEETFTTHPLVPWWARGRGRSPGGSWCPCRCSLEWWCSAQKRQKSPSESPSESPSHSFQPNGSTRVRKSRDQDIQQRLLGSHACSLFSTTHETCGAFIRQRWSLDSGQNSGILSKRLVQATK